MSAVARYLEEAATERLADRLAHRGYRVEREHRPYDLVASRDGERIAYEVIVSPAAPDVVQAMRDRREQAAREGFTDFRTVIATEPKQVWAEVAGLEGVLAAYLVDHMPRELQPVGRIAAIDSVEDVDLDELTAHAGALTVAGSATVLVDLEKENGSGRDGITTTAAVPFTFRLALSSDLTVAEVEQLEFDTAAMHVFDSRD